MQTRAPVRSYTVHEAAHSLGLPAVAVRYWLECFADELKLDPSVDYRLSETQVATLRRIQESTLNEGLSIPEVRVRLRGSRKTSANSPVERNGSVGALTQLERIEREQLHMREEIQFLLDEAKAHQQLLHRIVDSLGEIQAAIRSIRRDQPSGAPIQTPEALPTLSPEEWAALNGPWPNADEEQEVESVPASSVLPPT